MTDKEFELEFGDIQRTERLRLPTWEEFLKFSPKIDSNCLSKDFIIIFDKYCTAYFLSKLNNRITLQEEDEGFIDPYKDWELTKENYIEACKLCKRLFLKEE